MARDLTHNLEALDATEPYDVAIVGSGFVGTLVGTQLAEAGLRVLMLETGNSLMSWLTDKKLKAMAEYEFTGDTDYPLTRTTGRLIGGNSNFWTGRSDRFQPSDFGDHPYVPDGPGWPIDYDDLKPYYRKAEATMRVRGGPFSEHMPPRDEPLPLPGSPDISALKKLMAKVGLDVDDSPTATPAKGLRFWKLHKEVLPRFVKSRTGELVSGVTVTHLHHDDHGSVTHATVKTLDGIEKTARARHWVLGAGGIQNPRLLLLSKSERFPHGMGNDHDRVGRGFSEHPAVNLYGKIRHNRHTIFPKHKIGRTQQFYEDFRPEGLGAVVPVIIQSYLFPHHLVAYKLADIPRHLLKIASRAVLATLYIGVLVEQRVQDQNRITLSDKIINPLGLPAPHLHFEYHADDLALLQKGREMAHRWFDGLDAKHVEEIEVTWSRHHMGTCRMGTDPASSVVDENLCVHGMNNLYVGGCEAFVTGAGVPPTLTLCALSLRLADHLQQVAAQRQPDVTVNLSGQDPSTPLEPSEPVLQEA